MNRAATTLAFTSRKFVSGTDLGCSAATGYTEPMIGEGTRIEDFVKLIQLARGLYPVDWLQGLEETVASTKLLNLLGEGQSAVLTLKDFSRWTSVWKVPAQHRVEELIECAQDERITINQASLSDIRRFVGNQIFSLEPRIFLLDNGNFRVIWRHSGELEVGFEFLGSGRIRSTIIKFDAVSGRVTATTEDLGLNFSILGPSTTHFAAGWNER
jgi:hypothetical protein